MKIGIGQLLECQFPGKKGNLAILLVLKKGCGLKRRLPIGFDVAKRKDVPRK